MSVHRDCGEEIRWARWADNHERWRPPLEYVGEMYVIDEQGAAIKVKVYKDHVCDLDKMEAWQEYLRRRAELTGDKDTLEELDARAAYQAARELERENTWKIALRKECPTCEMPKGEKCRSLQRRHIISGEIVETLNPHPARLA